MVSLYPISRRHKLPRNTSVIRQLHPTLATWLLAKGSLTKQLTHLAQGQFHVELHQNGWQKLQKKEADLLNVPYGQLAWVREVKLYGSSPKAWVQARSVIPLYSLKRKARFFKSLGQKPIGKILFFRQIPQCKRFIYWTPEGWARMNHYQWHNCPLLVEEIFLHEFEHMILHK